MNMEKVTVNRDSWITFGDQLELERKTVQIKVEGEPLVLKTTADKIHNKKLLQRYLDRVRPSSTDDASVKEGRFSYDIKYGNDETVADERFDIRKAVKLGLIISRKQLWESINRPKDLMILPKHHAVVRVAFHLMVRHLGVAARGFSITKLVSMKAAMTIEEVTQSFGAGISHKYARDLHTSQPLQPGWPNYQAIEFTNKGLELNLEMEDNDLFQKIRSEGMHMLDTPRIN